MIETLTHNIIHNDNSFCGADYISLHKLTSHTAVLWDPLPTQPIMVSGGRPEFDTASYCMKLAWLQVVSLSLI